MASPPLGLQSAEGRHEESPQATLASLSDDELLRVLSFLSPRELLQCRGACRRLRDLALHPHLWRDISLSSRTSSVGLVATTLRLAPCLEYLRLDLFCRSDHQQHGSLLVSTHCAISHLFMDLDCTSAVFVGMMLARQAALGRLKTVTARVWGKKKSELRLLFEQLLHTPGLTKIAVKKINSSDDEIPLKPCLPKAAKDHPIAASLQELEYDFLDGTLPSYLKWHADTLQVVHLGLAQPPAGTAALLAALPLLRELKCAMLDGMPALLQCPALKSLHLRVEVSAATRPFLGGVQQYLRQAVAGRLEELTLEQEEDSTCADTANLVLCVGGPWSGAPSALRSLSLAYPGDAAKPQPQLAPLASVLHRLQNLAKLDLGGPHTADLLEALNGQAVPRLERLRVHLEEGDWGGDCPHEWAHGAEARALLSRCPRLHLEVSPLGHGPDRGCGSDACLDCKSGCAYCKANGCHDFVDDIYVLFSHPEGEPCEQDHGDDQIHVDV